MEANKTKDIKELYKLISTMKANGRKENANWVINFKVSFFKMRALGFDCKYTGGYLFWAKEMKGFI